MSRSSRHNEKLVIRSEIHREDGNEGTAARTRPFSYDEIMFRRKNKKQSKELAAKPVDAGNLSGEVPREEVLNRSQSGRTYRNTKLSSTVVAKYSSEDVMKVNSRYYEDNVRKNRIMQNIGKDNCDPVIRSKPTMNRDLSDEAKQSVDDRRDEWSRRHDNWSHGNIGNEYERRHPRHVIERKRYADKSRGRPDFDRKSRNDYEEIKFEKEIKRKQRNEDERSMQKNAVKKHDSGELYDQKPPERKDPEHKERKKSSQFHEEESRSKKICSRSREPDKDEDRRSAHSEQNDANKNDSGKIHDHEAPMKSDHERKERKELLQFHDDESRSKMKRSRSRELDKDKSRRSAPSLQNVVNKHDSGKRYDQEASVKRDLERKVRKESSQFHDEESKSKKKCSRSRDRDMDKGRRSASVSPSSHRHTEHGNGSSHSSKVRFGREQADDERNRKFNNGSSNWYRRPEGNSSGLGGYSPRKRKTEAGIRTPSPPHRSPEKKGAVWDLPSSGANTNYSASVLPSAQSLSHTVTSNTHVLPSMQPVTPTSLRVIRGVFSYASADSVQLTQATRPMRRLYVENLPASASEKTVTECLNNFLLSSGVNRVPGSQPCISCTINQEKGQALVEFLTPEDASAALYFDGRSLSGSVLKIRRPKDYTETGAADKSVATFDLSSNVVRDSPNKIFIGGIPKVISSDMLREIAAVFGPLKSFHFEVNGDLGGPCAFLEYADQSVTLKACASLNAMRLGGQMLTVLQATPSSSSVENFVNPPFYGTPEHAKPLLQKPTQVLKLKNVVNPGGLSSLSEQELEEILEDVRLECARFGTVNSVNFVKCRYGESMPETCQAPDSTGFADDEGANFIEKMKIEHHGEEIDGKSQETCMLEVPHDVDFIPETCKAPDSTVSADDIGSNSTSNLKTEHCEDQIDGNSQEISMSEVPCHNPKQNEEDKSLEENSADNVTSLDHSKMIVKKQENPSLKSSDFDHQPLDQNGAKIDGSIMTTDAEIKTEPMVEEILKTEEGSLEAVSKEENKETVFKIEDAFEPGSILVEYKRADASSVAAHSLHERLFDDRIVTVEYVDYDVFRARFLK